MRAYKNVASDVHGLRSTKLTLKIYPTGKAVIIVRFTYASGNVDLIIELWIMDGKLMGCYANDRALVPHQVSATPMQCAPVFLILFDQLTVLVVHLLDLEDIFPFAKVVVVELVPTGGSSDSWTRKLGKRGEEETVTDKNHRVDRKGKYWYGYIVFEQLAENARLHLHFIGPFCQVFRAFGYEECSMQVGLRSGPKSFQPVLAYIISRITSVSRYEGRPTLSYD